MDRKNKLLDHSGLPAESVLCWAVTRRRCTSLGEIPSLDLAAAASDKGTVAVRTSGRV
ncbi:MAG: hypothetical protein LAP85_23855 [Acidobacteriia bacterium]|nr:hypothetical protein [Terriglobia bacterium]